MTASKALLAGLSAIAIAILIVGLSSTPRAQSAGQWQISAAQNHAYKINVLTGEAYACLNSGPPRCYPLKDFDQP
jgi:hypothetical protein